jgi:hypothetical protein
LQTVSQSIGGLVFTASNLKPNTPYQFSVREQDQLTITAWSKPLIITTQASEQVKLWLDQTTASPVGTVALGTGNAMYSSPWTTPISIPANTPAGNHTLNAQVEVTGSPVASATITVVGAQQAPQQMLVVLDPTSGNVLTEPSVVATYPVKVRGEGFLPGVVKLYVDSASGQLLTQATVDKTGMFTPTFSWPQLVVGNHKIVAVQADGAKTLQASAAVFGEALPT